MPIHESTVEATLVAMREKLAGIVPEFELRLKAELVWQINQLKRQQGAVILGHNYMEPALYHTVPDIVGDSLELSRQAAKTEGDPIVFCGVRFMAETAKILNPTRTVLLPARVAGCSLAASISAQDVRELRRRYPGVPVVSYVNTYADVKAESDICCTSGNAAAIVQSLQAEAVIFLPDEYLAKNVAQETGRTIIFPTNRPPAANGSVEPLLKYEMLGWHGKCEVHEKFSLDDVESVRRQFPEVLILAHPECSPDVTNAADFSGSTSRMAQYVRQSTAKQFLLLTECSMGDNVAAENPGKELLRLCSHRCPHMAEITLQDTLDALRHRRTQIEVPEPIRVRARRALDRMLEFPAPRVA